MLTFCHENERLCPSRHLAGDQEIVSRGILLLLPIKCSGPVVIQPLPAENRGVCPAGQKVKGIHKSWQRQTEQLASSPATVMRHLEEYKAILQPKQQASVSVLQLIG